MAASWGLVILDAEIAFGVAASHWAIDLRGGLLLAVVWILLVGSLGGYRSGVLPHAGTDLQLLSLAALLLVAGTQLGLMGQMAPGHAVVVPALLMVGGGWVVRAAAAGVRKLLSRLGACRAMIVVGSAEAVERTLRNLEQVSAAGFRVASICLLTEEGRGTALPPVPVFHGLTELHRAINGAGADAVLAVPCRELTSLRIRKLAWSLEGTGAELLVAPGVADVAQHRTRLTAVGTVPLVHVRLPRTRGPRHLVKELVERAAAVLALVILAPVLLVLAAVVRLDSAGPAFYRSTRVGRDGRPFTMLKLRTMVADSELIRQNLAELNEAQGPLFKMRQDPRVTPLGRWLRRFSLDELPQLWNIARGQMALVGPRPALPAEVATYDDVVRRRMAVKPGLTGLWQVSGRSDLPWSEAVRLDLHYVDNWSLSLDLAIVARTFGAVLGRTGAY